MGLFDSGLRPPGSSFTFKFNAAGTYTVVDSATGQLGTLAVPLKVTAPAAGVFSLRWATGVTPPGYVYDIQFKRPASTAFAVLRAGTAAMATIFHPDAGAGVYVFRARIRNAANGAAAGWSPTRSIVVG
jgi:hypothetical protein